MSAIPHLDCRILYAPAIRKKIMLSACRRLGRRRATRHRQEHQLNFFFFFLSSFEQSFAKSFAAARAPLRRGHLQHWRVFSSARR